MTVLTNEMTANALNYLLRAAVEDVKIGDIVMCYTDEWPDTNWREVFSTASDKSLMVANMFDSLAEFAENFDLAKELFKPFLAEKLAETLGAKKVIIEW